MQLFNKCTGGPYGEGAASRPRLEHPSAPDRNPDEWVWRHLEHVAGGTLVVAASKDKRVRRIRVAQSHAGKLVPVMSCNAAVREVLEQHARHVAVCGLFAPGHMRSLVGVDGER